MTTKIHGEQGGRTERNREFAESNFKYKDILDYTTLKITSEPKNRPIEKENHLPNLHAPPFELLVLSQL